MGLLDQFFGAQAGDPDQQAASQQGLLALGLGLLGSKGSFSSALGNAGMQGMQAYQGAQDSALNRRYKRAQLDDVTQQAALRTIQAQKQNQQMDFANRLLGMGPPSAQQPGQPPAGATQAPPMGQGMPQAPRSFMAGSGALTPEANAANMAKAKATVSSMPEKERSHLAALSVDEIGGLIAAGYPKELADLWKVAKFGSAMQPGFRQNADGTMDYFGNPKDGLTVDRSGRVSAMPGAAGAQAELAGATTRATEQAKADFQLVPAYDDKSGTPRSVPLSSVPGIGGKSGAGASPWLVAPQVQAARDKDAGRVLQTELASAQQRLAAGDPRAAGDVAGIQREISRLPRGVSQPPGEAPPLGVQTGPGRSAQNDTLLDKEMVTKMSGDIQASAVRAQSAQSSMRIADQLSQALDSGKVTAGPAATSRIYLTQIGNLLGVAGDDGLIATRGAIQSMAKLAIEARGGLKGQGSISDYEGKTLEKGATGNINDLTVPEIRVIVSAAKKIGALNVAQHNELMKRASGNNWRDFYSEQNTPAAQAASGGGFKYLGKE